MGVVSDMCAVALDGAVKAAMENGGYLSFDLHYLSKNTSWVCVQFVDANRDGSYFGVRDRDVDVAFGFSADTGDLRMAMGMGMVMKKYRGRAFGVEIWRLNRAFDLTHGIAVAFLRSIFPARHCSACNAFLAMLREVFITD